MTATDTASAARDEAPIDENAAALAAIKAEADRAGIRLPRRAEDRNLYLIAIARHRGVVPPDAHIADPSTTVKQLLERAGEDELFGSSPAGRALVVGAAIWQRMNPKLEGVGQLSSSGRRGVHVAVAHLVLELQQDPARAQRLSPAEAELLRFYTTDELRQAVDDLAPAIDAAHARVAEAAKTELARPIFCDLVPRKPTPPQDDGFHFQDTRTFPGTQPVHNAAGEVVAHAGYGDAQPAHIGRTEPVSIPTPAALRGPRGW